jgi:cysteine-rich repeat protein
VRKATALGVGFGAAVALGRAAATRRAPRPQCANNVLEALEGCDDGNLTDGDGCDSTCLPTGCGSRSHDRRVCYDDVTVVTIGTQPQGVALADLNRDGHPTPPDSLGTAVAVYSATPAPSRARPTSLPARASPATSTRRLRPRQRPDLVVASSEQPRRRQRSVNGSGTFAARFVSARLFVRGFAIADFNGDTHSTSSPARRTRTGFSAGSAMARAPSRQAATPLARWSGCARAT